MYLDVKGLVTVARGNLIDPVNTALGLPFMRGAVPATRPEIAAEWQVVKSHQEMTHTGAHAFAAITGLRLSDKGIEDLVLTHLDGNEAFLRKRFPDFDVWPADAQLATFSMAWALGAGFHFPTLEAALHKQDFVAAALSCKMNEAGNPGLKPRNIANKILYDNAARVLASPSVYFKDVLYWPHELPADEPPPVVHEPEPIAENPPAPIVFVPPAPDPILPPKPQGLFGLIVSVVNFLLTLFGRKKP